MSGRARPYERALVWAAVAAFLAAALVWVAGTPGLRDSLFPSGSAFHTGDSGASLARAYLQRRSGRAGGPSRVDVLARPVGEHGPEAGAVVVRLRPPARPALLTPPERAWVESGGRLVVAVADSYGPLRVASAPAPSTAKVFPAWPGVARVEPPVARVFAGGLPLDAYTVLATAGSPSLVRWPLGRGEVVLSSQPEVLENGGLARADHVRLLESLAGSGRPVLFDEHVHGATARAGIVELLGEWGFGPALVLLLLVGLAALWRERARLGPPQEDAREGRTEAVDLLESLALLYDRSLSTGQALRLYRRGLERAAAQQTGLTGEALARRVDALLGPGEPTLAAMNDAYRRTVHGSR